MCDTCGCNVTPAADHHAVEVLQGLLAANDHEALHNREHLNDHEALHNREHFNRHNVLAINLMSSPGAGKTSLLEATIEALGSDLRIAVVEGDLETENDANRIRKKGVPAIQISTGSACHLDAHMVHHALHELDLDDVDVVFIENVGNLVCPASFDLGQHINVALLSTPEGDDKPAKYPVMFRAADLVLITKSDLLEVLGDFDPVAAEGYVRQIANPAPLFNVSASLAGLDPKRDRKPRMSRSAEQWLQALRDLGVDRPVRIMNVCGGHERSISLAGLRTAIPKNIELVPGPGCPVCICPEEDEARTTLARASQSCGRRHSPCRVAERSCENSKRESGQAGRIFRRGLRDDDRACRGNAGRRCARQPAGSAVGETHLAGRRHAVGLGSTGV